MWLLDEGLPVSLHKCLQNLKVEVETVEFRGWKGLRNGKLVSVAAESGFTCILTKDRLPVHQILGTVISTEFTEDP